MAACRIRASSAKPRGGVSGARGREPRSGFDAVDDDDALAEHARQLVEGSQQEVLTDLAFMPAASSRHRQEALWLESACRF